ncbi:MAG: MBOAT family protein [Lachnospiraceae bacterium]|nr:MBOAT family protein [Lachnospiraceae bacterium]
MIFNSIDYLLFFPVVVCLYFLMPKRLKNVWLLVVSYFFYMQWNAKYALLLAGSTFITYVGGLFIERFRNQGKEVPAKACLGFTFLLNLLILFFFKYINFAIDNINRLAGAAGAEINLTHFDILLPVGISFYIFQALSYSMDVYRGEIKATRNIVKYALFVSFFPQLVAGPIERSKNLLGQFDREHRFQVDNVRKGLLMMAWGLFMKMVISDNIAPTVDLVFGNYNGFSGIEIILAVILFGIQIYCDFGGYSLIAIGSAQILDFQLMENFKSPYYAASISEFWKRWHISLTSWFRDYLYIPLGGNRKGTIRKYINQFLIFFVSGIWHGAAWNYIVWGAMNGIFMILEELTVGFRKRVRIRFSVDTSRFSYRLSSRLITFALVNFTWLFFRANSIGEAFFMIKKCIDYLAPERIAGLAFVSMGMSTQITVVVLLSVFLLFLIDGMKYKGIDVVELVFSQGAWLRYVIYGGLLLGILFFGVYGNLYEQTQFIYFQF